ncbi:MAG: insulinase family protein [Bdellovibrionaceae bacterium]|nr:insulinase family protein [Pseudobdellovibrionaceae bacterium]
MMKPLLVGISAFLLISCASSPKTVTSGFQLREFTEERLPNGLTFLVIRDPSLPRVSLQMMVKTGGIYESKDRAGLSALTFGVLDQGTKKKKALQIADAFAQIGSEFGAQSGDDMSFISASGISPNRSELLKLFYEVISEPAFDTAEIERRKSQQMAAIQKALDQPQSYTDQVYEEALFENHPYANPKLGTQESVKAIRRADVVKWYQEWVQPANAVVALVGQVDDAYVSEVKSTLGQWRAQGAAGKEPTRPTVGTTPLKRLVTKKDLKQTQVRIGQLGLQRTDEDFLKIRMGALILGGAFASRLNQHIRDDLGLTYSIYSASDARLDRGAFEITTFTRNEKAADTIRETLKMVKDFAEKGVNQRELDAAKALMIGQFPSALETPDRLAYNLLVLRRYGIGDDYLRNFHQNVNAITLGDLNSAIRKHVKPDQMRIVVYGDQAVIGESLKSVGEFQIQQAK